MQRSSVSPNQSARFVVPKKSSFTNLKHILSGNASDEENFNTAQFKAKDSTTKLLNSTKNPFSKRLTSKQIMGQLKSCKQITNQKRLTLKQLKESIAESVLSKQKHNSQSDSECSGHQTMAQHLQTFLNQRYGLKQICLDMHNAIM